MNGVDTDLLSIAAPSGMEVAPNLAIELLRREETSDVHPVSIRRPVKNQRAHSLTVWIGVGQNPTSIGRIGAVAISCQNTLADDFYLICVVSEQEISVTNIVLTRPGENLTRIAPIEVRCHLVVCHAANI